MKNKRTIPILSIILYGLATFTLLVAISILLTALSFERASANSMSMLTQTADPQAALLGNYLKSAVEILGIVFAGMTFTMSALLFTARQLLLNSNQLSQRIGELEKEVKELKAGE